MKSRLLLLIAICILPNAVNAEDINQIFKKVNEYVAAENYPKALAELQWASKELQKKHSEKLGSMLPDSLAGFKGEPLKSQSVLGMNTVEKVYRNGSAKLTVSLTGGAGSAGAGAGNLAAIGRMAAMMGGNSQGVETFRIEGRTANLNAQQGRNRAELSVFLESGDILKLELQNTKEQREETLKTAVNEVKLVDLDNYLKGAS